MPTRVGIRAYKFEVTIQRCVRYKRVVLRTLNAYPMKHVDVLLPSQHFGASKKVAPEYRLMIAVLEDAITCVTKYRSATDTRGRRLFDEEQQWLFSEETHWPYAFACICDVLDLDADAVRRHLGLVAAPQLVVAAREADGHAPVVAQCAASGE